MTVYSDLFKATILPLQQQLTTQDVRAFPKSHCPIVILWGESLPNDDDLERAYVRINHVTPVFEINKKESLSTQLQSSTESERQEQKKVT